MNITLAPTRSISLEIKPSSPSTSLSWASGDQSVAFSLTPKTSSITIGEDSEALVLKLTEFYREIDPNVYVLSTADW